MSWTSNDETFDGPKREESARVWAEILDAIVLAFHEEERELLGAGMYELALIFLNLFFAADFVKCMFRIHVNLLIGGAMSLHELQSRVNAWMSQWKDGYWTPHENLARLTEEVGELAREINHSHGPKKKKEGEGQGSIAEELGDIVFVVVALANSLDIDLDAAMDATFAKYNVRDKDRFERNV